MNASKTIFIAAILTASAVMCFAAAPSTSMSLDQASLLHVGQGGGGGPGGGGDIRWPYCSGNANCTQCMGYYSCENFINFPWCRYVATEYSECNNNYPFSCGSTYWWTVLGCGGTAIAGDECFGNDC